MIKASDYEAIIFDFGGVLINIDYNATIDAFKALGINDFEEMYSQADQNGLFDAIETGQISSQHFINKLLDYLPSSTTPNQVVSAWNKMILNVPSSRIELLQKLKSRGQRIFLLSNTNAIHIDYALRQWSKTSDLRPEDLFDKVYYSHEIHMRKPDSEIFEFVCNDQGLDESTTLFIDDSIQHIEGAKAFGLNTHWLQKDESIDSLFLT